MTVGELFYNKVIKDYNVNRCPYKLETRSYEYNGKVFTERHVRFLTDHSMNGIHDDIRLLITEEEYEFLLEKMKQKEKKDV